MESLVSAAIRDNTQQLDINAVDYIAGVVTEHLLRLQKLATAPPPAAGAAGAAGATATAAAAAAAESKSAQKKSSAGAVVRGAPFILSVSELSALISDALIDNGECAESKAAAVCVNKIHTQLIRERLILSEAAAAAKRSPPLNAKRSPPLNAAATKPANKSPPLSASASASSAAAAGSSGKRSPLSEAAAASAAAAMSALTLAAAAPPVRPRKSSLDGGAKRIGTAADGDSDSDSPARPHAASGSGTAGGSATSKLTKKQRRALKAGSVTPPNEAVTDTKSPPPAAATDSKDSKSAAAAAGDGSSSEAGAKKKKVKKVSTSTRSSDDEPDGSDSDSDDDGGASAANSKHDANDGDEVVGPGECAMCERAMPMTRHHLMPKTTHDYWVKRGMDRKWMLAHTVDLCRECHNAIHRLIDEETMARDYRSLEALLANEAVAKHAKWASKQKVSVRSKSDAMNTTLKYRK